MGSSWKSFEVQARNTLGTVLVKAPMVGARSMSLGTGGKVILAPMWQRTWPNCVPVSRGRQSSGARQQGVQRRFLAKCRRSSMVSLDAWSETREKRKVEEEIGKQKGTRS